MNKFLTTMLMGVMLVAFMPRAHAVSDGTGNDVFTGNVGIGSLAPGKQLDVQGTVRATYFSGDGSGLTGLPATGWTLGASNVGISTTNNVGIGTNLTTTAGLTVMNGNVGIGTWIPGEQLTVFGNVGIGTTGPGSQAVYLKLSTPSSNNNAYIMNTSGTGYLNFLAARFLNFQSTGGSADGFNDITFSNSTTSLMVMKGGGNIGISSTAPGEKLDVTGTIRINEASNGTLSVGNDFSVSSAGAIATNGGYTQSNTSLNTFSGQTRVTVTGTALTVDAGNTGLGTSSPSSRLSVLGGVGIGSNAYAVGNEAPNAGLAVEGNVGVGTFTPLYKLDVRGTVNATAFVGSGAGLTNLPASGWTLGASNVGISTTNNVGIGTNLTTTAGLAVMNGNVGIGTWIPTALLTLNGGFNTLINSRWTTYNGSTLYPNTYIEHSGHLGQISIVSNSTSILTVNSSYALINNVNVGIGTTVPGEKLDVAGTVRILNSGNLGIGTSYTPNKLYVAGTAEMQGFKMPTGSSSAGYVLTSDAVGVGTWMSISAVAGGSGTVSSGTADRVAIYDTATNTVVSSSVITDDNTNIGIGSVNPTQKLDVAGTLYVSNNVGIGTIFPTVALEVVGSQKIRNSSDLDTYFESQADAGGYFRQYFASSNGTILGVFNRHASSTSKALFWGEDTDTGDYNFRTLGKIRFGQYSAPAVYIDSASNKVGIGSTAPGQALDVQGTVRILGGGSIGIGTTMTTTSALTVMNGNVGIGTWVPRSGLIVERLGGISAIGTTTVLNAQSTMSMGVDLTSVGRIQLGNSINGLWVYSGAGSLIAQFGVNSATYFSDNVGLGSTIPGQKLDVAGTVRILNSGNLGIGTSYTPNKLYVAGTAEMQGFKMPTGSSSAGYVLTSDAVGVGTWMSISAVAGGSGTVSSGTADRVAIFDTAGTTVTSSSVITDNNTNVGISSTAPTTKLDVAGTITATNIRSLGATTSNNNSVAIGNLSASGGTESIVSSGTGSLAMGRVYAESGLTSSITASNYGSFAFGSAWDGNSGGDASIVSSGEGSLAFGATDGTDGAASITADDIGAIAMGVSQGGTMLSSGLGSVAMGFVSSGATLQATGQASVAIGQNLQATAANAFAFGSNFTNNDISTFKVGFSSTPTLTVTSANLGIGSTAPQAKLDVAGTIRVLSGNIGIGTLVPRSTFDVEGSVSGRLVTKTSNYTATSSDYAIMVNASGGNVTISLPAATSSSGRMYHVKKTDSSGNSLIIDPNGAENIDGQSTLSTTTQYQSFTIICDGTQWWVI